MKRLHINLLLVSVFILLSGKATCQQNKTSGSIISTINSDGKIKGEQLFFWENTSNDNKFSNPETVKDNHFRQLPGNVPNFGFIRHDVWFNFKVDAKKGENLIISLSNPNLDKADLWIYRRSGALLDHYKLSDLQPFSERPFQSRKFAYPVSVDSNEILNCYLRVNNGGEQFHFTPEIESERSFLQGETSEGYFLGIYFGILLFVILFNVFMWVITREKLSLHYSLYLITFLFLQASLLGYGKEYLWNTSPYLANHANPVFASLSILFLLRFSRLYLDLKILLRKWDKFFAILEVLVAINVGLALIPEIICYTSSILLINALTLGLNIAIIPLAIIAIRKGHEPAKLFLIAFLLLVVSVFAFVLKNFGVLPSNFFTDFGFQFGSSAEVILFSLGIVIRFRNFREDSIKRLTEINELKEKATIELEKKVVERTSEIARQKLEIEEKNTEILASITYAKRIQEAILPDDQLVKDLLPGSSILYLPKDIVAGDFYWMETRKMGGKEYLFFAVGDCTGHGVPGAMMSVLCTNALNTAVAQLSQVSTAELLEICNKLLSKDLSIQSNDINDGMDISICCFEPNSKTLIWSGANNPIWIKQQHELHEISGTKRPIGKSYSDLPFEEHRFSLTPGDRIILFTDGIIDQFGGPGQKKFKKSKLREALDRSMELDTEEQVTHLRRTIVHWMSDTEQIDDITVMIVDF